MNKKEIKYFKYLGIKVNNINFDMAKSLVKKNIKSKKYICATCVTTVMGAVKDEIAKEAINNSYISLPDGTPLVWYGKIIGCKNIQRISGPFFMERLLEGNNEFHHLLLGDTEETINSVIRKAKAKNPKIKISGYSPPFKEEFSNEDNIQIINRINTVKPDIIWVSFGGKKQDKWMYHNIHKINRGVMIGVGAAFKFYIGKLYTPPKIIQYLGLQWLVRLYDNPKFWLRHQPKNYFIFLLNFPREVVKGRISIKRLFKEVSLT